MSKKEAGSWEDSADTRPLLGKELWLGLFQDI
jgi:hypothetical protein